MEACKVPCNDCPFRENSLPGWLSTYTPAELHHIVMTAEMPFPCHKTHSEKLSWKKSGTKEHPLCAGALRYMKKACKLHSNPEIQKHMATLKPGDLKNILSVPDFFSHHSTKKLSNVIDSKRSGRNTQ